MGLSKESLLWAYRLHDPNIKLSDDIEETLSLLKKKKAKIIILTDGRSITQRLKINALGLNHLPNYISEDFNSEKPSPLEPDAIWQYTEPTITVDELQFNSPASLIRRCPVAPPSSVSVPTVSA